MSGVEGLRFQGACAEPCLIGGACLAPKFLGFMRRRPQLPLASSSVEVGASFPEPKTESRKRQRKTAWRRPQTKLQHLYPLKTFRRLPTPRNPQRTRSAGSEIMGHGVQSIEIRMLSAFGVEGLGVHGFHLRFGSSPWATNLWSLRFR